MLTDDANIYQLISHVIDVMKDIGTISDVISVLQAIKNGYLNDNIAFHLLLDIGDFYSLNSINNVRYSKQSLGFWVTVQKLFKGKGINFFRGFRAEGQKQVGKVIHPSDCEINFLVPSDPILVKEASKFRLDASKPGLLEISLDAFATQHKGDDVKLSIDGKRIATGFGKMGEEDLGGFESKPTLQERQARLASEIKNLDECREVISENQNRGDIDTIRGAFCIAISHLSVRIKELRELEVKKKSLLGNLMKKVEGDWTISKLAPAISYLHTKIVQTQTSANELLDCTDQIGFVIAVINGTNKHYVRGRNAIIELAQKSNYVCLRSLEDTTSVDMLSEPEIVKQRTSQWHKLRDGSKVTGSSMFKALGLDSLKAQHEHYDKVFKGIVKPPSSSLQELFDYGTTNEINALATLLGKVMPVYYPHLLYREDGCAVLPLKESYMVVSGDGCGVTNDNTSTEVVFEFKCPRTGKERVTDLHYKIPVYYLTQVASEMVAHGCKTFAYICYTPQSSTFITGSLDEKLWTDIWSVTEELYGEAQAPKPKKRHEDSKRLLEQLHEYASRCSFSAEFPSVQGKACGCSPVSNKEDIWGYHQSLKKGESLEIEVVRQIIDESICKLRSSYNFFIVHQKKSG